MLASFIVCLSAVATNDSGYMFIGGLHARAICAAASAALAISARAVA